jgi:hypothetical protein
VSSISTSKGSSGWVDHSLSLGELITQIKMEGVRNHKEFIQGVNRYVECEWGAGEVSTRWRGGQKTDYSESNTVKVLQ